MASGRSGASDEVTKLTAEPGKTLKEGERILAPTRRPDGTLRKPVRIRAGYVPQDEVAIYQSKGALWKKEISSLQEVPPGYDPAEANPKPKSKSTKRNERRKEKRQQAAQDKTRNSDHNDASSASDSNSIAENAELVTTNMNNLSLSEKSSLKTPQDSINSSASDDHVQDIDKKIRALKKKIRLTEAQQQKTDEKDLKPEQLEKIAKLEGWRNELKHLEDTKANLVVPVS